MSGKPWSPEELAALRAAYNGKPGGLKRAVKACPDRARFAISQKAQELNLPAFRSRWTPEELRILQAEWGDTGRRRLKEKLPGRNWNAICTKAHELGLPPQTQGANFIVKLAYRFGCCRLTLRRVLDLAGVAIRSVEGKECEVRERCTYLGYGAARKARAAKLPTRKIARPQQRRVDAELAEIAWRAWCDLETVGSAARTRGICEKTLRDWLQRSGAMPPSDGRRNHKPLPTPLLDEVIRTRGYVRQPQFDVSAYLRAEVKRRRALIEITEDNDNDNE